MKLLLDTHIFLWLNSEPETIPPAAYDACRDPHNQLYLSHVSPWEIQIKQQLGKLQLRVALPELIATQTRENGLTMLPDRASPYLRPQSATLSSQRPV
jgi:PIN domain nuclease of toxin-antitoxin system